MWLFSCCTKWNGYDPLGQEKTLEPMEANDYRVLYGRTNENL